MGAGIHKSSTIGAFLNAAHPNALKFCFPTVGAVNLLGHDTFTKTSNRPDYQYSSILLISDPDCPQDTTEAGISDRHNLCKFTEAIA